MQYPKNERHIANLSNEVSELLSEIHKCSLFGPEFKRDNRNTAMDRIALEMADVIATFEHAKQFNGFDIDEKLLKERIARKKAILRMEDMFASKEMYPVRPILFKETVQTWLRCEHFYRNYPVSLIHDTLDLWVMMKIGDHQERDEYAGTLSEYQHAIFDYFHSLMNDIDNRREKVYQFIDFKVGMEFRDNFGFLEWDHNKLMMALIMCLYYRDCLFDHFEVRVRMEAEIKFLLEVLLPKVKKEDLEKDFMVKVKETCAAIGKLPNVVIDVEACKVKFAVSKTQETVYIGYGENTFILPYPKLSHQPD